MIKNIRKKCYEEIETPITPDSQPQPLLQPTADPSPNYGTISVQGDSAKQTAPDIYGSDLPSARHADDRAARPSETTQTMTLFDLAIASHDAGESNAYATSDGAGGAGLAVKDSASVETANKREDEPVLLHVQQVQEGTPTVAPHASVAPRSSLDL